MGARTIKKRKHQECGRISWQVCPHIHTGEYLSERYEKFGMTTFVYGAILCDDCYSEWVEENKTQQVLESCQSMCDDCMRLYVFDQLCLINHQVLSRAKGAT